MNACKEKQAVHELITADTVENYNATLDQFFECWLTSDLTDTANADERSARFTHLKYFKKFLKAIGEE